MHNDVLEPVNKLSFSINLGRAINIGDYPNFIRDIISKFHRKGELILKGQFTLEKTVIPNNN
jgi:hypothetical protein